MCIYVLPEALLYYKLLFQEEMDLEANGGSTPNNGYNENLAKRVNSGQSAKSWRLLTAETLAPQPALYDIPDRAESVNSVGAGIWTVFLNLFF